MIVVSVCGVTVGLLVFCSSAGLPPSAALVSSPVAIDSTNLPSMMILLPLLALPPASALPSGSILCCCLILPLSFATIGLQSLGFAWASELSAGASLLSGEVGAG